MNMQSVNEILSELENADDTTKNKIENELVSIENRLAELEKAKENITNNYCQS